MNQTILRIGFFLVGNHQYFIQNYTQILSFADQNFGSTETPVFWKRQGNRRIWFLYMIILITSHASYMYQDGYSNTYIISGDLFFFWQKIRIQRFWCMLVYEMQFLSEHFPNVFFFVNYNALRFLTKGCHYSQYSWNFKKVWDMLFSKWII